MKKQIDIDWDEEIRRIDEQEKWFQKWIISPIIPERKKHAKKEERK